MARAVLGLNPGRGKRFSVLQKRPDGLRAHLASCSMGTGAPSPRVKWPLCNVKHAPRSNAEVKSEWSSASVCLHGVKRENYLYSHICNMEGFRNIPFTVMSLYFNFSLLMNVYAKIVISTKYNKKQLNRVELSFMCCASLIFPLGPPLYVCITLFEEQQGSVHYEVAGCHGVCRCGGLLCLLLR
jgi:hypothetical protein